MPPGAIDDQAASHDDDRRNCNRSECVGTGHDEAGREREREKESAQNGTEGTISMMLEIEFRKKKTYFNLETRHDDMHRYYGLDLLTTAAATT